MRHTDLPLAHSVVRIRPWVSQRGQSPTLGAKYTGATAITCGTTKKQFGFQETQEKKVGVIYTIYSIKVTPHLLVTGQKLAFVDFVFMVTEILLQ